MARTTKDCINAIKQADAVGDITDAQADELLARIDRLAKARQRKKGLNLDAALKEIAGELIGESNLDAKIKIRNGLLAKQALDSGVNFSLRYAQDTGRTLGEGLRYILEGGPRLTTGSRRSIDATGKAIHSQYLGMLAERLEREGVMKSFKRGEFEEEIFKELWELSQPADTARIGVTGNEVAKKIAAAIHDVREQMRVRLNEAGAYIQPIPGYVARQMHDGRRIRKLGPRKESFETWYNYILPLLDEERTFRGEDPKAFLRVVHENLYTDNHLKDTGASDIDLYSIKGGSLANRISAHRKLHFRSAEAALAYQRDFGVTQLKDNILNELHSQARNIALMEGLGPNPEDNFARMRERLTLEAKSLDLGDAAVGEKDVFKQVESLRDARLQAAFDTVSGVADVPQNVGLARVSRAVASWQRLSKMGAVVVSAFGDKFFSQVHLARQGISQLDIFAKQITGMGPRSPEAKQRLMLQGAMLEGLLGNTAHRYDAISNVNGRLGRAEQWFFNANGLNWWTNTHKAAAHEMMSAHLAAYSKGEFGAMPAGLQVTLRQYDIGPDEWAVLRKTVHTTEDGYDYVLPGEIRTLSDSELKPLLGDRKPTTANLNRLRNRLETSLRTYLSDQADLIVPTPGAAERRIITGGLRPGTATGDARRLLLMFKSFPLTVINNNIRSLMYGHGANTAREFLANDRQGKLLLIQLVAMTTIGGYLSGAIREALRGRTPPPLIDEEGNINTRVMVNAMLRGGALGIYGDLLLSEYHGYYQSFTGTMAGPVFGQLDEVARTIQGAAVGEDKTYEAMRLVRGNLPFTNLFYVRPALDYLLWWNVQEMLSPGSLERMEDRIEEQGQEFFIRPTDVAQ